VLPRASADEHWTVVAPMANVDADAGTHVVGVAPSTTSDADAANVTDAPLADVASVVMVAGTVTAGAVESRTVTMNPAVAALPRASADEHVTVVAPRRNVDPGEGVHVSDVAPSTESSADTENGTGAPLGDVASAIMSAGTVKAGGVVSTTVMVNAAEPVLPWASVDEQRTVAAPI